MSSNQTTTPGPTTSRPTTPVPTTPRPTTPVPTTPRPTTPGPRPTIPGPRPITPGTTTPKTNNTANITQNIFNKFNIIFLIWFLAIYLIIYFLLGIFYNPDNITSKKLVASRIFDFFVFFFFLLTIIINFLSLSDYNKQLVITQNSRYLLEYINNIVTFVYLIFFFVIFYGIIYITGIPMTYTEKPITITLIEGFAWILFALVLIANFCKYVLNISIVNLIYDWISKEWNKLPNSIDLSGNIKIPEVKKIYKFTDLSNNKEKCKDEEDISGNEVFNIARNMYTYEEARAVCSIYDSKLATYSQIEKSYKDGGEWCNYGWSEDQMIYFPTQKATWDKLQKNPKTKNICGRPGINGGYIDNPYVRFGVNCYGKKPEPSIEEKNQMSSKKFLIPPKTKNDLLLDEKIKFWKDNSDNFLNINAFNNEKWSEY